MQSSESHFSLRGLLNSVDGVETLGVLSSGLILSMSLIICRGFGSAVSWEFGWMSCEGNIWGVVLKDAMMSLGLGWCWPFLLPSMTMSFREFRVGYQDGLVDFGHSFMPDLCISC